MSELERKLARLVRTRAAARRAGNAPRPLAKPAATARAAVAAAAPAPSPDTLSGLDAAGSTTRTEPIEFDESIAGAEVQTPHGAVHVHDTAYDVAHPGYARILAELFDSLGHLARVPDEELDAGYRVLRDHGLEAVVFLDLETGGLAGQPIFLAGLLQVRSGAIALRQVLARDYAEESALIARVAAEVEHAPLVVTYNGKAFDLPMLEDRARYHGLDFQFRGAHLDLLHAARRRYRHRYPDCRLTTLEWFVCHRRRFGDLPGREIPGRFHRFMQDRDPSRVIPVMHHNALDLVTLLELCGHLAPCPPEPRFVPDWGALDAVEHGVGEFPTTDDFATTRRAAADG